MVHTMADFDSLASAYDAWFDGDGRPVFDAEVEAFREVLPLLPRPWLEVGVGSGRFAQALGIDTGIDPSVRLLLMAGERGTGAALARGEDLPFRAESFGTVFLIVTLCFVASPFAVLVEARRVLKDVGKAGGQTGAGPGAAGKPLGAALSGGEAKRTPLLQARHVLQLPRDHGAAGPRRLPRGIGCVHAFSAAG